MRLSIPIQQGLRLLSDSTFNANFAFTVRLRGSLSLQQLETALAHLGRRHPLISSRVLIVDDKAFLTDENVPSIPLRVVPRESENTRLAEVDRELKLRFDYQSGPLFRCTWVRGQEFSELILVGDHISSDGRSGIYAIRDLLKLIAEPHWEYEVIQPIRLSAALPENIKHKAAEMLASIPVEEDESGPWINTLSSDPRTFSQFSLTEAETAALTARCRNVGVSVQSALCAAFLKPFAENEPGVPIRKAEVPVDLRPYLSRAQQDWYGMFISLAKIEVDCSPEQPLWDIARRAFSALKAINKDDLFFVIPAVLHVADRAPKAKMIDKDYDVSISNLGRVDLQSHYGFLELLGVPAPSYNVIMTNHRYLGVITFQGKLTGTLTTRDPQAPALIYKGVELLRKMINA